MNYYDQIKEKLIDVEVQNRVKDYSKNKYTLEKYFEVGRLLVEAQNGEKRAKYGDELIKEYSIKLAEKFGNKYSYRTLFRIKQFYIMFQNKKMSTLSTQLSWSHYQELLSLNDFKKINYYINKSVMYNLSVRKLRELIKSNEYERLSESAKSKLIKSENTIISDIVPNPIIIKNNANIEVVKEKTLQQLILDDIPSFLEQLGNGFTFIKNEYPIRLGDTYNYIDLLLFNIIYNCYVIIELKIGELKKDNIGQILTYMNYIDNNIKLVNHNNTVGIILTRKDNKYIAEYCSNYNILSREYIIY